MRDLYSVILYFFKNMHKHYLLYIVAVLVFFSCVSTNNSVTLSSDPTISSFYLTNDSFPVLKSTAFVIEEGVDTGLIYNADSIKFGTPIDSVKPTIYYNASAVAAAVFYTPTDTIPLSSNDTIDFSQRPVLLHIISQDLTADKWYNVEVNVHQVDPDLYIWEQTADNLYSADYSAQKAVIQGDSIFLFISNGFEIKLLATTDGYTWTAERGISGLPQNVQIKGILSDGKNMFVGSNDAIYTSTDAQNWTISKQDESWVAVNMLFNFNNQVWAAVLSDGSDTYDLLSSADGTLWSEHKEQLSVADFPYTDYAAAAFLSASGRQRAILAGGYNISGMELKSVWNVEYDGERGYNWKQFTNEDDSELYSIGISILPYNNHLIMFGMEDNGAPSDIHMMESYTEGYSWTVVDTAHNKMPDSYIPRVAQTVVIDSANHVFMIGGRSKSTILTDVYKGKLNSVDW